MTKPMTPRPPLSAICEVCRERASARRLQRMSTNRIWTVDLCAECYARERGPVTRDDMARLSTLLSGAEAVRREADELRLRAAVHQQTLPAEWLAVIDGRASRASV